MENIQPYLDFFAQHPVLAITIVFLVSVGEALLVIGLFIPSTAVLVGAGALVGTGKLPFWPVMIATIVGCIVGDQISYWAGRMYGDRLRTLWPLRNYPVLLAKGEEFVRKHGGKSVALGRFVPGVKAVVPGIAGMFGMSEAFFLSVNIVSGIFWAAMHILPGVLLGQALTMAGELSGRLVVVVLILLVVLGVAGWLIRLFAASLSPYRKAAQARIAGWAGRQNSKALKKFGTLIAPDNAGSTVFLLAIVLGLLAVLALFDLVSGLMLRQAAGNFDHALFNLFSEVRSAPADEIFVRLTMLGDETVIYAITAVMVLWLLLSKSFRAAFATIGLAVIAKLILLATSVVFSSPVASRMPDAFAFPSSHALMAGAVLGALAVISAQGLSRWVQALVAAICGMIVITIAFSRLYLGVNWLSDILGGLLVAAILVTLYGAIIAAFPPRHFRPLGLVSAVFLAFLVVGGIHISRNYDYYQLRYQPADKIVSLPFADFATSGSKKLAPRRIDIAGRPGEFFIGQWIGTPDALQKIVLANNFKVWPKWTWHDYLPYLDPHAPLSALSPRPALHEGLRAKLTASQTPADPNASYRLTLRAYQSNFVAKEGQAQRIYYLSVTHEILKPHLSLLAVPSDVAATRAEAESVLAQLRAQAGVQTVSQQERNGFPLLILRAKSP